MNKVSKYLLSLILTLCCAMGAKAYDLVVTVNNPELVNVLVNYSPLPLTGTTTTVSNLSGYNYLMVSTNDAVIQKVVKNGVTEENPYFVEMNMNDDYGIKTFTLDITAIATADMPKKSFTAVIDNPARVELSLAPKGGELMNLKAGENVIEYIPETSTYLSVNAPWGEAPVYKVETTGPNAAHQYGDGGWEVDLEEGAVITITADYPDESVPVTFDFANDGRQAIASLKINGEEVKDFDPDNFSVKLGSKLSITLNKEDFVLNSFFYNDFDPYMGFTDTYSTFVTGPATISLDATKNKMVEFTVDINMGAGVLLYRSTYIGDSTKLIMLNDGENTVEVNAAAPELSLVAADGYVIEDVKLNGRKVEYDAWAGQYSLSIKEGDEVTINVTKIVRDQKIALYLTDKDMWSNFYFTVGTSTVSDLHNGYNILEYAASELSSVGLNANSWYYDTSDAQLYVNDVLRSPEYVGSFQFALSLENGDVVKVFFAGAPEKYNVKFNIDAEVEVTEAIHDYVAPFDAADGLECFEGTEVSFCAKDAIVTIGGIKLEAADNVYSFVVNSDTVVTIEKDIESGADVIATENTGEEIYNLQGVRITRDGQLPAGIYIINGRKIIIR